MAPQTAPSVLRVRIRHVFKRYADGVVLPKAVARQ